MRNLDFLSQSQDRSKVKIAEMYCNWLKYDQNVKISLAIGDGFSDRILNCSRIPIKNPFKKEEENVV